MRFQPSGGKLVFDRNNGCYAILASSENKSLLPLLQSKPMQQTSVSSVKGHRDVSKGHRDESNAYARVLNKRRELGQPEPDLNLTIFDEPLLLYPSEYRTGSITDDVDIWKSIRQESKENTPVVVASCNRDSAVGITHTMKSATGTSRDRSRGDSRRSSSPPPSTNVFESLPYELLEHIFAYLDSLSLKNLSSVNHWLRGYCYGRVWPKRGIATFDWTRRPGKGRHWMQSEERRTFSTYCEFTEWRQTDTNVNEAISHIAECPHNKYFDPEYRQMVLSKYKKDHEQITDVDRKLELLNL